MWGGESPHPHTPLRGVSQAWITCELSKYVSFSRKPKCIYRKNNIVRYDAYSRGLAHSNVILKFLVLFFFECQNKIDIYKLNMSIWYKPGKEVKYLQQGSSYKKLHKCQGSTEHTQSNTKESSGWGMRKRGVHGCRKRGVVSMLSDRDSSSKHVKQLLSGHRQLLAYALCAFASHGVGDKTTQKSGGITEPLSTGSPQKINVYRLCV